MTQHAGRELRALFLVWAPPSRGARSRVFARELGVDVEFVYSTRRRGLLVAPVKYAYQAVATLAVLGRRRPRLVLVQSPPSFAVMFVALYAVATGARYIVDAHSDAMLASHWTRPRWLHRLLLRTAVATIVTNEHFAGAIREQGGRALVLRDIPTSFPAGGAFSPDGDFNVMVVNSFAVDEPLAEVMAAAATLEDVSLFVTGDLRRAPAGMLDDVPANVRFTGFLPDEEYYALMRSSQAVMCLTTRDHTMQRGACEALSLGRPIITSDWPLLRDYFRQGTVHVDNTAAGIHAGIVEMMAGYASYEQGIAALQTEQRREWDSARRSLAALIAGAWEPSLTTGSSQT